MRDDNTATDRHAASESDALGWITLYAVAMVALLALAAGSFDIIGDSFAFALPAAWMPPV